MSVAKEPLGSPGNMNIVRELESFGSESTALCTLPNSPVCGVVRTMVAPAGPVVLDAASTLNTAMKSETR